MPPDTSVPPSKPLVPFKLIPWCWSSEGMSLSKSTCGFFKRYCLGLQKFLTLTQSPLLFAASNLSSWHWDPELVGSGMGLGLLAPERSFPNFYPPCVGVGPARSTFPLLHASTPPTSLDGCGFFNSVVIRLPLGWISDGSQQWLFFSLVVILM